MNKTNLGCSKILKSNNGKCGVPNAWGGERFCSDCKNKLLNKWEKEDVSKYGKSNYIKNTGGTLN